MKAIGSDNKKKKEGIKYVFGEGNDPAQSIDENISVIFKTCTQSHYKKSIYRLPVRKKHTCCVTKNIGMSIIGK